MHLFVTFFCLSRSDCVNRIPLMVAGVKECVAQLVVRQPLARSTAFIDRAQLGFGTGLRTIRGVWRRRGKSNEGASWRTSRRLGVNGA